MFLCHLDFIRMKVIMKCLLWLTWADCIFMYPRWSSHWIEWSLSALWMSNSWAVHQACTHSTGLLQTHLLIGSQWSRAYMTQTLSLLFMNQQGLYGNTGKSQPWWKHIPKIGDHFQTLNFQTVTFSLFDHKSKGKFTFHCVMIFRKNCWTVHCNIPCSLEQSNFLDL